MRSILVSVGVMDPLRRPNLTQPWASRSLVKSHCKLWNNNHRFLIAWPAHSTASRKQASISREWAHPTPRWSAKRTSKRVRNHTNGSSLQLPTLSPTFRTWSFGSRKRTRSRPVGESSVVIKELYLKNPYKHTYKINCIELKREEEMGPDQISTPRSRTLWTSTPCRRKSQSILRWGRCPESSGTIVLVGMARWKTSRLPWVNLHAAPQDSLANPNTTVLNLSRRLVPILPARGRHRLEVSRQERWTITSRTAPYQQSTVCPPCKPTYSPKKMKDWTSQTIKRPETPAKPNSNTVSRIASNARPTFPRKRLQES